nr:single-stranded DNA-binding protein [Bacillus sp. SM2101]
MNNANYIGRLTKDIELRHTPNGVAVANFTIAVNRTYTNEQGKREADFIPVVVWKKQAENCANYLKKGSQVGVTGRMQSRLYEGSDGKRVPVIECNAESVQFLDTKSNRSGSEQRDSTPSNDSFGGDVVPNDHLPWN